MRRLVVWDERAIENLLLVYKANPRQAERLVRAIYRLASDRTGDIRKLEGQEDSWRLRVGDWRVVFYWTDSGIRVAEVINRRDAYR